MENEIYYDMMKDNPDEHNPESGRIGFAVTSLVLGIVALVLCCCGLGYICAPLSIIFGIISLAKRRGGTGMAITGIILSAITIIVLAIFTVLYGPVMKDCMQFSMEADAVIEEYEETGELPDYLEKYRGEDYDEFWEASGYKDFDEFFEEFIDGLEQQGVTEMQ
ncbi:MAG: DUF4190 domain-containing protein [Ruminococcus sp.]|nr:DUF4190 domain-containing protein [Ruminococcus sp.]